MQRAVEELIRGGGAGARGAGREILSAWLRDAETVLSLPRFLIDVLAESHDIVAAAELELRDCEAKKQCREGEEEGKLGETRKERWKYQQQQLLFLTRKKLFFLTTFAIEKVGMEELMNMRRGCQEIRKRLLEGEEDER